MKRESRKNACKSKEERKGQTLWVSERFDFRKDKLERRDMDKGKGKCGFMTRNEVMEYLGISQNTFYRHFAINLQGYTVGNRIKYKREDVDALLKRV